MPISTQDSKIHYVGDGVATLFPFPYPVFDAAHVRVFTPNKNELSEEVTTGFDVLLNAGVGASVQFYQPVEVGKQITIARILPFDQTLDLENGGNFSAEEIETTFDRTVMQIQQLNEGVERAVKVPINSEETPEEWMGRLFEVEAVATSSATLATTQADRSEECADTSCECAMQAQGSADEAKHIAESLPGFANNAHCFWGLRMEKGHLVGHRYEQGETIRVADYNMAFLLPAGARFYFEDNNLMLEMPFTA